VDKCDGGLNFMGAWMDETRKSVYFRNIVWNTVSRKPMPKGVAMFHAGRSGSTVLGNLFNQHPDLFWDSEVLQAQRLNPLPGYVSGRIIRQIKFHLQARRRRCVARYYGFEAKPIQVSNLGMTTESFIYLLNSLGYERFIVLERRNLLRIIVSHLVAKKSGNFHNKNSKELPETQDKEKSSRELYLNLQAVPFQGTKEPLITQLKNLQQEFIEIKRSLNDYGSLQLVYEDDIEREPRVAYRKVCEYLDIPILPVEIQYRKTNPTHLSNIIENFEDLAIALWGSEFEWMLDG
jgi:hypothetical protein